MNGPRSLACSVPAWCISALTLAALARPASADCPDKWYPIFGVPPGTDGQCRAATLWDPDGDGPLLAQPVVAGEFTKAGGVNVARIARFDGDMWLPFGSGAGKGLSGDVRALTTWDPDGSGPQAAQLIAGGDFFGLGSLSKIARWDGAAWQPMDSGFSGSFGIGVHSLASWDPDGAGPLTPRLIAGGNFSSTPGGATVNRVAWWDGTAWQPLGNGFVNGTTYTLAVYDPDGSGPMNPRLVAGGHWTMSGTTTVNRIAWWDGSAWQPLGSGFNQSVTGLTAWDADGPGPQGEQIVATGDFTMSGTTSVAHIARWDGATWQPLGAGVGPNSYCVGTWDPDGPGSMNPEVVAAGNLTFAGGTPGIKGIARWNGSTWQGFGTGMPSGNILALTNWDPDGGGPLVAAPVAVGQFQTAGTRTVLNVASWQGDDWRQLGNGLWGQITGQVTTLTTWDPDGPGAASKQLVAGGSFTVATGRTVNRIARFDGSEWHPLGTGFDASVWQVTTWDPDGGGPLSDQVVAVGDFSMAGATAVNGVARFDGTQWHPFGSGVNGSVNAVTVLDTDGPGGGLGAIVVGGAFTEAGGQPANYVAMWNGTSWQPMSSGFIDWVNALASFSPTGNPADTRVYAGGRFGLGGAPPFAFIAQWNGNAWESLDEGLSLYVHCMTIWNSPAPRLVVGGAFTHAINGTVAYRTAAWTGSNWVETAFEPGLASSGGGGVVYALTTWDADGSGDQVVAGGNFDKTVNLTSPPGINNIARWDGDSWTSIGGGTVDPGGIVFALTAWDPDGNGPKAEVLVTGGVFSEIGGLPGPFISAAGVCASTPCPGDLDGDNTVGQSDLGILLAAYGTCPGEPNYNAAAGNLAGDPCVTQADLGVLLGNYGMTCP